MTEPRRARPPIRRRSLGSLLPAAVLLALHLTAPVAAQDPEAPAEGLALLERAVSLVEEHVFDPGLVNGSWRAAVAAAEARVGEGARPREVLPEMLEHLGTSHTAFYTADDREYHDLLAIFRPVLETDHPELYAGRAPRYEGIGVLTRGLEGGTFVSAVLPGGPAAAAGVLRGDELLSVEGEPWGEVAPFRGRAGTPTRLALRRTAGGPVLELEVIPRWLDPATLYLDALEAGARTFERGGRRIACLRVFSYAGQRYRQAVEELLLDGPLAGADALVLDLRDGWGGANPEVLSFFAPPFPRLTFLDRGGETTRVDRAWREPVALLVDSSTRSGKEILAYGFRHRAIGPVVGERTAGAVLGGRIFVLPGRSLLYLPVRDVEVDGERLEGVGVAPSLEVAPELPWAAGEDPQLEAALEAATRGRRLPHLE